MEHGGLSAGGQLCAWENLCAAIVTTDARRKASATRSHHREERRPPRQSSSSPLPSSLHRKNRLPDAPPLRSFHLPTAAASATCSSGERFPLRPRSPVSASPLPQRPPHLHRLLDLHHPTSAARPAPPQKMTGTSSRDADPTALVLIAAGRPTAVCYQR